LGPCPAQKESAQAFRRQFFDTLKRVYPMPRRFQNIGIEIGSDDRDVRGLRAEGLGYRNRDRIGFFAGRRGRTPDPDRAPGADLAKVLGEDRKVVGLPKERRQVGGQRIDETFPFVAAVLFQRIEIFGKAVLAGRPQTTGKPGIDHVLLDRRQGNPGMLIDQFAHAFEIGGGKNKLPYPTRLPGQQGAGKIRFGIIDHTQNSSHSSSSEVDKAFDPLPESLRLAVAASDACAGAASHGRSASPSETLNTVINSARFRACSSRLSAAAAASSTRAEFCCVT